MKRFRELSNEPAFRRSGRRLRGLRIRELRGLLIEVNSQSHAFTQSRPRRICAIPLLHRERQTRLVSRISSRTLSSSAGARIPAVGGLDEPISLTWFATAGRRVASVPLSGRSGIARAIPCRSRPPGQVLREEGSNVPRHPAAAGRRRKPVPGAPRGSLTRSFDCPSTRSPSSPTATSSRDVPTNAMSSLVGTLAGRRPTARTSR